MIRYKLTIAAIVLCTAVSAQYYTDVSTYAGSTQSGLVNGTLASARFNAPYSLSIDRSTGTIYVADTYNNCIRKIQNGQVTTLAGNGAQGDQNGQGSSARFYVPTGLDYSNGYVYVCDNGNHKIKRIDAQGNVTTIAGTGEAGTTDGPALSARFFNPTEVRVNSNGVIYVSDYGNHTIRQIENGVVSTLAGLGGMAGDQLGTGSAARFNRPTGLAFDDQDNLYVADQVNCKVKKVTPDGAVTLLAGSGQETTINGTGAQASFMRPTYMGWDPTGALMVAEWEGNVIRRITLDGTVSTVAGTGSAAYLDGPVATTMFHAPYGVCVDAQGNGYIGDKLNNCIRILHRQNAPCMASAGTLITPSTEICLHNGTAQVTAVHTGDMVVPSGYSVVYLLTRSSNAVIEQMGPDASFQVSTPDHWEIHTLVYDPATFDLSALQLGITTLADVEVTIAQGGALLCADLDEQGAAITTIHCDEGPCEALAGGMTGDAGPFCIVNGSATLAATPTSTPVVPPGFHVTYVLTRTNGLILSQYSSTPTFTVTTEDIWRIHELVYDPATLNLDSLIQAGTYFSMFYPLLVQGGGTICANFDIYGAPMKSAFCTPQCTAGADTTLLVCYTDPPVQLIGALPGSCPGGSWSAPGGMSWSGVFDPAIDPAGGYMYMVPGGPGNATDTAVVIVELVECPEDVPTGMSGTTRAAAVGAWPVPAHEQVHIAIPEGPGTASFGMDVFNARGQRQMVHASRSSGRLDVDVLGLPNGVYVARITSGDRIFRVAFIKE